MHVLGQAVDPAQTQLSAYFGVWGSWSNLFALMAGVLIFAGACRLILKQRKAAVLAAYLVLLPLPVLISIGGNLEGMISSFLVIAATPDIQVTTADYAGGMAYSCLSLFVAMLVSAPTYAVLAFGLLSRAGQATNPAAPA